MKSKAYHMGYKTGLAILIALGFIIGLRLGWALGQLMLSLLGSKTFIILGLALAGLFFALRLKSKKAKKKLEAEQKLKMLREVEEEYVALSRKLEEDANELMAEAKGCPWMVQACAEGCCASFRPVRDLIAHDPGEECVCYPKVLIKEDCYGQPVSFIMHSALDGRPGIKLKA